jgi:hypothetical protein
MIYIRSSGLAVPGSMCQIIALILSWLRVKQHFLFSRLSMTPLQSGAGDRFYGQLSRCARNDRDNGPKITETYLKRVNLLLLIQGRFAFSMASCIPLQEAHCHDRRRTRSPSEPLMLTIGSVWLASSGLSDSMSGISGVGTIKLKDREAAMAIQRY